VSLYDGVVTFDDSSVPVIIGLQEDGLRMSSGGAEIGQWGDGEYSIDPADDGTYTITAENESLRFVPTNPSLFAAGVGVGADLPIPVPGEVEAAPSAEATRPTAVASGEVNNGEAPAPRTITLVGFYLLAVVTAGLGLWALVSLFL